jgi:hypothetical protein
MKLKEPKFTSPQDERAFGGFFDGYPRFYETCQTDPHRNRLNRRYDVLIAAHEAQIRQNRILDIASHDGRWSFAALERGARHVMGIEGRSDLVEAAGASMQHYGIDPARYAFVADDIHRRIALLEPGQFDTIFCFGFFYHTPHHCLLVSEFKRLRPKWVILDTVVRPGKAPIIYLRTEDTSSARNAIGDSTNPQRSLSGRPSVSAMNMMLENAGFHVKSFDWSKAEMPSWERIRDYKRGRRVTVLATMHDTSVAS